MIDTYANPLQKSCKQDCWLIEKNLVSLSLIKRGPIEMGPQDVHYQVPAMITETEDRIAPVVLNVTLKRARKPVGVCGNYLKLGTILTPTFVLF